MKIFGNFKLQTLSSKKWILLFHLTALQKIGTLKGPKESSADSELLNFSLAWILLMDAIGYYSCSWQKIPCVFLFFSTERSYETLPKNQTDKRRNLRTGKGFLICSISHDSQMLTDFVGHVVFTPWCIRQMQGLRGSDLSCCKSQLVLALLGQWPLLHTLHLRLPVTSTCSNAVHMHYNYLKNMQEFYGMQSCRSFCSQ